MLAEYSPAVRVVVSAAVISSVVGASVAAGEKGGVRRLAFVNARLIPCLLKASIERQLDAITTALSRAGADSAGALADVKHAVVSDGPARVQRLLEQFSTGFNDALGGFPGSATDGHQGGGDGSRDAGMMTQVGIVLGLAYMAFLTAWFWATRRGQEEWF
jgi:hypothetical protein